MSNKGYRELPYDVILSRLHQIQGDLAGAAGHIQHALALMKAEAPAVVREEVVAQQVRFYLAQGQHPRPAGAPKPGDQTGRIRGRRMPARKRTSITSWLAYSG